MLLAFPFLALRIFHNKRFVIKNLDASILWDLQYQVFLTLHSLFLSFSWEVQLKHPPFNSKFFDFYSLSMGNNYWKFYEKIWSEKWIKTSLLDGVHNFCLVQRTEKSAQPHYKLCWSQKLLWCCFQINSRGSECTQLTLLLAKPDLRYIPTPKSKKFQLYVFTFEKLHAVKNIWEGQFSYSW